ncbi:MAG: aminomethyltransferase, partial [Hyphomicrobiales bacterium]
MNELSARFAQSLGPPAASRIFRPGMPSLPAGTERYKVAGRGSCILNLNEGDEIHVTDLEGRQPCEILVADKQGRIDAGILGQQPNSDAAGIQSILIQDSESAKIVVKGLRRRKIDLAKAGTLRVFSSRSSAGNSAKFVANRKATLLVAAPGEAMRPDTQSPPTPIELIIKRANTKKHRSTPLPE